MFNISPLGVQRSPKHMNKHDHCDSEVFIVTQDKVGV
jgi:hypothetical protein